MPLGTYRVARDVGARLNYITVTRPNLDLGQFDDVAYDRHGGIAENIKENLTNLFNRLNWAQAGHAGFPFTGRARVAAKTGAEQVPRSYVGSVDAAYPRLLLAR